jgi:hypothetical protein
MNSRENIFRKLLFILLLLAASPDAGAQSRSAALTKARSLVQEIKSEEKEYETNRNRISALEADIERWLKEEEEKLNQQRQRLAAKLEEIETSPSWKNRKKTAESGYKEYNPGTCSAGGPPPICSANHWYHVGISEAMADYEAYKKKVLDELRDDIEKTDRSYSEKIRKAREEISSLTSRNNTIQGELPQKRIDVGNTAYDWMSGARKDNEEKEKKWKEAVTREEAYRQVLEHNLSELERKLGLSAKEYLDAYSRNFSQLEQRYQQQKKQITDGQLQAGQDLSRHNAQSSLEDMRLKAEISSAPQQVEQLDRQWQTRELPSEEDKAAYQQQRRQLEEAWAAKQDQHTQFTQQSEATRNQLQDQISMFGKKSNDLEEQYAGSRQKVEEQLKSVFQSREDMLKQMQSQTRKDLARHMSVMEQNRILRKAEVDEWNNQKGQELRSLEESCREVNAACSSIYTPLSHLPSADIDLIGAVFKDIPGGWVFEEFADKVLRLSEGTVMPPTYKAGKSGTQSYFESKMGVQNFLSLKARMEEDPLNPEKALDMKMCLEALGRESCVGVRTNRTTGQNEYYIDGVFKENLEILQRPMKEMDEQVRELQKKAKQ